MATNTPVDIGKLIHMTPGVYGGRPCLVGTRMPVRKMAIMNTSWGMSAEEILEEFPHLDLARIHAALAYYYADQAEIEADQAADERFGEVIAALYPNGHGSDDPPPPPELLAELHRDPGPFFDIGTLIEVTPGVRGGPALVGTSTPVSKGCHVASGQGAYS